MTLHTAFSRKEGVPKTYVQHLMAKDAGALISILGRGGHLYVCGDGSKMAPDVEATLQKRISRSTKQTNGKRKNGFWTSRQKAFTQKMFGRGFERFDEKDWMTPVLFPSIK